MLYAAQLLIARAHNSYDATLYYLDLLNFDRACLISERITPSSITAWQTWREELLMLVEGYVFQHISIVPSTSSL